MAYFSNGTEGFAYQKRYCYHCRNWRDRDGRGDGCAVWDAHMFVDRKTLSDAASNPIHPLSVLIPMVKSEHGDYTVPGQCAMFDDGNPDSSNWSDFERWALGVPGAPTLDQLRERADAVVPLPQESK